MILMSTDVKKIAENLHLIITDLLANLFQICSAIYLLGRQLGAVCIAPVILAIAEFRNLSSALPLIYNFLLIFTQFFTLSAYAIVAKLKGSTLLTDEIAVTSLLILTILDHPLSMFLLALPKVYVSAGCFQRIQEFLLKEPRVDQRVLGSDDSFHDQIFRLNRVSSSGDIDLMLPSAPKTLAHSGITAWNDQVVIKAGEFGWSNTNSAIIHNVTLRLLPSHAQLTMIASSVGCGKSIILKGMLGESSTARELVHARSEEIASSKQTRWLINRTIRENVIAESSYGED